MWLWCACIVFLVASARADGNEWAGCSDDQINRCTQVVHSSDDSVATPENFGLCESREYGAEFTHTCIVKDYRPTMEFCCCKSEQRSKAMCCRYHQNWNIFRCNEDKDTFDLSYYNLPPLEVLLPAVIIPVLIGLCCIFCCVKCCCYGEDGEDNYHWTSCKCWPKRKKSCDKERSPEIVIRSSGGLSFHNGQLGMETQPLTSQQTPPMEERKQPPDCCSSGITGGCGRSGGGRDCCCSNRNCTAGSGGGGGIGDHHLPRGFAAPSAPPLEEEDMMYRQHPPGGCPLMGSHRGTTSPDPLYASVCVSDQMHCGGGGGGSICAGGHQCHHHHHQGVVPTYERIGSRSGDSTTSTNSNTPPPHAPGSHVPGHHTPGSGGAGDGSSGDCCNKLCANCSANTGAPPAYEESLCHPIMPE